MINFRQDKVIFIVKSLRFKKKTMLIEGKLIFYKTKVNIYGNIVAF